MVLPSLSHLSSLPELVPKKLAPIGGVEDEAATYLQPKASAITLELHNSSPCLHIVISNNYLTSPH